jgi:hypothetical protein
MVDRLVFPTQFQPRIRSYARVPGMADSRRGVFLAKRFAPAVGPLVAWWAGASHQSVHIPPYRSASTSLLLCVELAGAIGEHSLGGGRPSFVHTRGIT